MRTLREFILEQFDKISTEWVIEHYKKFNNMYFDNKLPNANEIDLQYTSNNMHPSWLGAQGFHKPIYIDRDRTHDGMYLMLDSQANPYNNILDLEPFIYVNNTIPMTMNKFEDTLIHEMVHLWTRMDCTEPKQAHGKEFKKKCDEIRKLAKDKHNKNYELTTFSSDKNSYDTATLVDATVGNRKNVVGVFIKFDKSKLENERCAQVFLFCTTTNMNKIIDYVKSYYGKFSPKIYITDNTYRDMCVKCGIFKTVNMFRYYTVEDFKEKDYICEIMTKNADIINEGLTHDEMGRYLTRKTPLQVGKVSIEDLKNLVYIPGGTNLSEFNAEDIVDNAPELHDEEIR